MIRKQSEKYPDLADRSNVDAYAKAVEQLPNTGNDCTAVFNAHDQVFKNHKTTMRNLFHGNPEQNTKTYESAVNFNEAKVLQRF